jgi:hypothetical protein
VAEANQLIHGATEDRRYQATYGVGGIEEACRQIIQFFAFLCESLFLLNSVNYL